jgi:hypothetical protein
MELKRIPIKRSSRFRTFNLPVSWLKKVNPRNGDEFVVVEQGDKLIFSIDKKKEV